MRRKLIIILTSVFLFSLIQVVFINKVYAACSSVTVCSEKNAGEACCDKDSNDGSFYEGACAKVDTTKYGCVVGVKSNVVIKKGPASNSNPLVPCGRSDQGGTMCTLCDLVVGVKGLIDFGFKIIVIVGIVMITIAGVLYIVSTGETSMMENAKGMLKNTLIGFAIILGGWLMVNTLMWVMGTRGAGDAGGVLGIQVKSWDTFTCDTKTKQ